MAKQTGKGICIRLVSERGFMLVSGMGRGGSAQATSALGFCKLGHRRP